MSKEKKFNKKEIAYQGYLMPDGLFIGYSTEDKEQINPNILIEKHREQGLSLSTKSHEILLYFSCQYATKIGEGQYLKATVTNSAAKDKNAKLTEAQLAWLTPRLAKLALSQKIDLIKFLPNGFEYNDEEDIEDFTGLLLPTGEYLEKYYEDSELDYDDFYKAIIKKYGRNGLIVSSNIYKNYRDQIIRFGTWTTNLMGYGKRPDKLVQVYTGPGGANVSEFKMFPQQITWFEENFHKLPQSQIWSFGTLYLHSMNKYYQEHFNKKRG